MNHYVFDKLQYTVLKERLKSYCISEGGKKLVEELIPSGSKKVVLNRLTETSEGVKLLNHSGSIPIQGMERIEALVDRIEKDMILEADQLMQVADFLRGCRKMKVYMQDKTFYAPTLYGYTLSLQELRNIEEEIYSAIRNGIVVDEASKALKKVRRHIAVCESKIEDKLDKFLKNSANKMYIQEFFVSKRQGRLTVPIKAAYKNKIEGTVIESNKKTVFIEPSVVSKYTNELTELQVNEAEEIYKVLTELTSLIYDYLSAIKLNLEVMTKLDMITAKAKYSKSIEGIEPQINDYGKIKIVQGKHPLLTGEVVPLDFEVGDTFRSLIITGPNAGGKTVVLKTVGIFTLMMQSGLHVPAKGGTNLSVFDHIYVDIGDDQSLENSLSTFSSHVKNLAEIIKYTQKSTLLLFDEIGSGTEPGEGAALAIAILEKLYHKGAIIVATTHYNTIKEFSHRHSDFRNAAMMFNPDTLEPQYRLLMDQAGESNALWISRKMGIEEDVLKTARKYMNEKSYDLTLINPNKIRKKQSYLEEKDNEIIWQKGDKVYLLDESDYGLVYAGKDKYNEVTVYYKDAYYKIHEKKLKLEFTAKELYPEDYDLDSLFIGYSERKVEKDVARGSKKMLKKIRKHGIEEVSKNHRMK